MAFFQYGPFKGHSHFHNSLHINSTLYALFLLYIMNSHFFSEHLGRKLNKQILKTNSDTHTNTDTHGVYGIYCVKSETIRKIWWPLKGPFDILWKRMHFKLSPLGFVGPIGPPWWLSWYGWQTSRCLRKDEQGKPRWPPAAPSRTDSWNQVRLLSLFCDQCWRPRLFHIPTAGTEVSWWGAWWNSDIFWSHGEQQCRACNDWAPSLRRWPGRFCERPCFLRWIYGRSA